MILIAQSNEIIERRNLNGVIFSQAYQNSNYNWSDEIKRFTPTIQDVELFENDLKAKLKKINGKRWNQVGSCPIIHKNLRNYIRQYLGFINKDGKKYLLINFVWKNSALHESVDSEYYNELGDWKKHWQIWYDGCSHFWNIKYYIDSDTLFDLQINGSS